MSRVVNLWRHVYLKLRQARCGHRIRISEIKRLSPELVECPCVRCGKVLRAPYGLAIDAEKFQ